MSSLTVWQPKVKPTTLPTFKERYHLYLKSNQWKDKRAAIMARCNAWCERCKNAPADDVHHLTYYRIFHEPLTDLAGVCRQCHEELHK